MPYGYIYLTENLINGRCYIGQHKAKVFDKIYKGSGKLLTQAFKKYGRGNFISQPIAWANSKEELDELERCWIAKCKATENPLFYNIAYGGDGAGELWDDPDYRNKQIKAHSGKKQPIEQVEKMRESCKEWWTVPGRKENWLANRPDLYDHNAQSERAKLGWITRKAKREVK